MWLKERRRKNYIRNQGNTKSKFDIDEKKSGKNIYL